MGLRHEQDRLLRAKMIVKKVIIEGKSQQQTAREMGISHDTVARGLALARQAQVYLDYEHKLFDELVPLAHEAVKMELADGNGELGLKILQGANIIKTKSPSGKAAQEDEDTLYGEIARLRDGAVINVTPQLPSSIVETGATGTTVSDGPSTIRVYGITQNTPSESPDRTEIIVESVEGEE